MLNVPDVTFWADHNPASTWMHNESVCAGCVVYNKTHLWQVKKTRVIRWTLGQYSPAEPATSRHSSYLLLMWQRLRTPHSNLLLQSLEELGVMHHFPSLCPPSLSLSADLLHYFPSIHLSISLLSSQRGYIILSSHMAQRTVLFPP